MCVPNSTLVSLVLLIVSIFFISLLILFLKHRSNFTGANLPPGMIGYPIIGESLEFLAAGWKGHPQRSLSLTAQPRTLQKCSRPPFLESRQSSSLAPSATRFCSPMRTSWSPCDGRALSTRSSLLRRRLRLKFRPGK